MLRKKKWKLFAISLGLLGSACATPPNVPACEHLGQRLSNDPLTGHLILSPSPTCMKQIKEVECGHCVYIVNGKEIFVGEGKDHQLNGKPWSLLRQQSILLPSEESYTPLASYIINACKEMDCSDEVTRFQVKLNSLNGIGKAFSNP